MTALSDNRQTDRRDGILLSLPVGVDIVYRGAMVCKNTAGYVVAAQDTAGFKFAGVAYEKKDNSGGSNGDENVRVYRAGTFKFAASGMAITDEGKRVYVADDQTVQLAQPGGGNVFCGIIAKYESATEVWVDIGPATGLQPGNLIVLTGAITAATTTAGGDAISLANPFGQRAIIMDMVLDVTTPATGAATMDVGVAANGTTSADTLIDGVDVGSAAIIADNIDNAGTNGLRGVAWGTTQFITATPSATLAGLVGTYYVTVLLPSAA